MWRAISANLGPLPCLAPVPNSDKSKTPLKPYPVMAENEADHVGDIVAMVVADTTLQGRDAAELIGVAWEELPAAVDMEEAIRPGAPLVFAGAPDNVAYDNHIGDKQKTDAAFARAAHTVRIKIVNPRVVANYMEPRAAVGEYDSKSGRFTLNVGSQGVHGIRDVVADEILKIPRTLLRVVTQDVGGGFGTKQMVYREYPLVLDAARRLGRSVELDGRPQRAFRRRRAGPRQCDHGRNGARRRRAVSRAARRYSGQSRRQSDHVRALYPLARRDDGDRAL